MKLVINNEDGTYTVEGKVLSAEEFQKLKDLMLMSWNMTWIHLPPDSD